MSQSTKAYAVDAGNNLELTCYFEVPCNTDGSGQ